ncbi:hypothetical protein [Novosphingopyxis iocasae]|uniref:hypothetical protein n=1 Tax=Novosphingopyxis iocasae TaxID=2762729 RepID=UPI001651A85E|nr:hypothetical protein [Novosphingopyxis iocasae]
MTFAKLSFALAAGGFALAAATPAAAQDNAGDRVQVLAIYGDDACPPSTADEIVVCKRFDESERYRIPKGLRSSDSPENESWSERVRSLETIGQGGIGSCTPTGPGGVTGCTQQLIQRAYAERNGGAEMQAGLLVQEERAKRLARIDEEAAETERLVQEELARRDAREKAQAAAAAGETPADDVPESEADPVATTPLPEPQS